MKKIISVLMLTLVVGACGSHTPSHTPYTDSLWLSEFSNIPLDTKYPLKKTDMPVIETVAPVVSKPYIPYPGTKAQKAKFYEACFTEVRKKLIAPLEAKVIAKKVNDGGSVTMCLQGRNRGGGFD